MAGVPVKFRCYRCNQLLGVSRSKVGAIVACPKCAAELVVPDAHDGPAATDAGPSPPPGVGDPAPRAPGLDVGLPLDFLSIRPEDIRVEPGFAPVEPPDEDDVTLTIAEPPAPATFFEPPPPSVPPPQPPAAPTDRPAETMMTPTPSPPPPAPVVPPIRLDGPVPRSSRRPASPPVRAGDLVLPRSVVASWSLFVIIALALAFLAGLLAGHYVWRVH